MTMILLVDDNSVFLLIYGKLLGLIGFDTVPADGKEECMQVLASEQPDLILLDIMMEPYDGWDTLQSVRNNIQTQDLPIMILTGKRPTVEEIDRYGGAIEDYLMKPVAKAELKDTLEDTFERIRQRAAGIETACDRGCSLSDIAEYVRLERAVRMDEKFRGLFVEITEDQEERIRQRKNQLDSMKERLGIR